MPATRTRSAVLTVCVALSLSWSEGKTGEAVDDAVCAQLAQQSSVEYRPDVNAQGQAVAPADLGGRSSFQLPEEITIPLAVDAIERYGGKNAGSAVKGEAGLGTITVRGGQVFFNGTLVAQMDRAAPGRGLPETVPMKALAP